MSPQKPFAPAAERNRHAILTVLKRELSAGDAVLEIGSGTGQHACHFASLLPDIRWLPSDRAEQLPGIRQWIKDSDCRNIAPPVALELGLALPPLPEVEHCFSANTLHIMHWPQVEALFDLADRVLGKQGKLMVYGPFSLDGDFGGAGNVEFDARLKADDPARGIREIRQLDALAQNRNLSVARSIVMPSNNRLLIWQRC